MKYLALFILVSCNPFGADYKAGDCVTVWNVPEFPETGIVPFSYSKILKIGKNNYLLETHYSLLPKHFKIKEESIRLVDRIYDRFDCSIVGL